jgi:hypothetical protein
LGNFRTVYALSPEDLLKEKAEAYLTGRKIRNLYDAFFLLGLVERSESTKRVVGKLVSGFRPPVDEAELKTVVLYGTVPRAAEMLERMRR